MKKILALFAILPVMLVACEKPNTVKEEVIDPPTGISIDQPTLNVAVKSARYVIEVTSPARPVMTTDADWVTVRDRVYDKYKIKYWVYTTSNRSYDARTATFTVSCEGAQDITFKVEQPGKTIIEEPELPSNDAVAMAKKIGFGWNLGNQFEAYDDKTLIPSETAWTGVACTQATFDAVAAAGLTSVRIPITWLKLIGDAPDYTLDADRLARVKEVVGYAHNAGLLTIINIHHDGAESKFWLSVKKDADNEAILKEINAVWTQLANAFKDEGDWLVFESFNEINDGEWGNSAEYKTDEGKKRQNDILNGWNQKFVDAVRATGGNNATRWLGVAGYCASPEFTLNDGFVLPTDPANRIMVGVHEYTPYNFCQTASDSQWGNTREIADWDDTYEEDYMKGIFHDLYTKWVANNVPVYLGEFGCANHKEGEGRRYQLYYLEYLAKCAQTYGLGGLIWDNGGEGVGKEKYGIFNHGDGSYVDASFGPQIVAACLKGFTDNSEGYTLLSIHNSAPIPDPKEEEE
ncbi:MAG: cellulase family glycosylhydrolase [Bacteroidales bacterium]|nr:cellulase family glycosylhydrolase [Bacteroidales bacterium]